MAIINDYADIRARMKGDLKAESKKPEPEIIKTETPTSRWRELIMGGFDPDPAPAAPPKQYRPCPSCRATGHSQKGKPGTCINCSGKGYL